LPSRPLWSVVIVTRNEGAELEATVENIRETLPDEQRELIVVDDGSEDGSTAFLSAQSDVAIVRSSGIGVARARNAGAERATGDIILFSDAHVRAPAGWHENLAEALRSERVGAVAPGIYSITEPDRRGFGLSVTGPNLHASWRHKERSIPTPVPVLPGCFLAMRRETYRLSGGYDTGMRQLGGNDAELSCRLWLLGYELLVVTEVEVGHLFRTVTPFPARWAAVLHNRLRTALVHFRPDRVERVVRALRAYDAFPTAVAMLLESDVHARRRHLEGQRRFDDEWFFERFAITC
jgi:GT2 family glycosyltransferase